jgi:hypothetical protein
MAPPAVNAKWLHKLGLSKHPQQPHGSHSLAIRAAIAQGAPLFNSGKRRACYEAYLATAYASLSTETLHSLTQQDTKDAGDGTKGEHTAADSTLIRAILVQATREADEMVNNSNKTADPDYDEGAWILRRAFDRVLQLESRDGVEIPAASSVTSPVPSALDGDLGDGSAEKEKGASLAALVMTIEQVCEIKDCRFHLKNYPQCFVGNEAVSSLVNSKVFMSRSEAVGTLNRLLEIGLLHHVTREHAFQDDDRLFYRLTSVADLRVALNAFRTQTASRLRGAELIQYAALVGRYKQFHKHPSLGVLRLDYDYPPAPGDIDHPDSYTYPVHYRVVPGLTFAMCQEGKMTPEVEKHFDEAALWLAEHQDVSAITGDCGFMMWFTDRVKRICGLRKPVLLSALMQLPTMVAASAPDDKIIIMTANGQSLLPMRDLIKRQCGVDSQDSQFVFVGCEDVPHFGDPVQKGLQVDVVKAQPGIVQRIQEAIAEHPETHMILLECTELPPYADAIREATRLPVYGPITNCDFVLSGFLDNKAFGLNGWYEEWDGLQDEYVLGQNLNASDRLQCVWCKNNEFNYA